MRFATIFAAAAAVAGVSASSLSVIEISTCVPTVVYSTITVSATEAATTSKVPYPITGSATTSWAAPSGTGAYHPSGSANATASAPLTQFTGAANAVSGSFVVAGAAAAFAVLMV